MRSLRYTILAILASLFFTACASFEKGKPQEVVILSFPTEASVYIDGLPAGITPITLDLSRKVSHEIRLEKKGFNSAVKYINRGTDKIRTQLTIISHQHISVTMRILFCSGF